MTRLIVERSFSDPLTDDERVRMFGRLGGCLEQRDARWIRSVVSADRRRMFCEFEAPDADAVRTAHRLAGVPFERVWPADVLEPADSPSHAAGD